MFVDRIKVFAQAGNGGRGCVSFRREKFVPKGGPDGGDGGRGGDVILHADRHVDNLANLFYEPIIKAKNGSHGKGKKMAGHMGAKRRTIQNIEVVRVDKDRQLLLVHGAIPGCPGGDVIVKLSVKAKATDAVTA